MIFYFAGSRSVSEIEDTECLTNLPEFTVYCGILQSFFDLGSAKRRIKSLRGEAPEKETRQPRTLTKPRKSRYKSKNR